MYGKEPDVLGYFPVVGCPACGVHVSELITQAHLHDDAPPGYNTIPLCWNCHWLYDGHILTTGEVIAWFEAALENERSIEPTTFYTWIYEELRVGRRYYNRKIAKKAARKARETLKRKAAARKAWQTRRITDQDD